MRFIIGFFSLLLCMTSFCSAEVLITDVLSASATVGNCNCSRGTVAVYGSSNHGEDAAKAAAISAATSDPSHPDLPSDKWVDACADEGKSPDTTQPPEDKKDCVISESNGTTIVKVCVDFKCS